MRYHDSASGSIITDDSDSRTILSKSAGRWAAVQAIIRSRWYEDAFPILFAASRASGILPSATNTYGVTHAAHSDPASRCTKSLARSVLPSHRNAQAHDRKLKLPGSSSLALLHSCIALSNIPA